MRGRIERRGQSARPPEQPMSDGEGRDEMSAASPDAGLAARLESEGLLILDSPAFALNPDELELAGRRWGEGGPKNVSYNPAAGRIDGAVGDESEIEGLRVLLARFSAWSLDLIARYFPAYRPRLDVGRASLRFRSVEEAPRSWRKDDRRLHVDAFTSQPVAGRRILRVFSNIDPEGAARRWAVGEAFEAHARRFQRRIRRLAPGEAALLEGLGLTKSRRTNYDQAMLCLHDAAKRDADYQASAPRRLIDFPRGATWVVFTDQTPHAALSGRGALEQTFYLPVEAQMAPTSSPLRILERLLDRPLA
jgi:hypothetical protein